MNITKKLLYDFFSETIFLNTVENILVQRLCECLLTLNGFENLLLGFWSTLKSESNKKLTKCYNLSEN